MADQISSIVPTGGWDTHIHVFEPAKHPYSPARSYTPAEALIDQYPHSETGCINIVIVQATVQGSDPAPLLDVLTRPWPANKFHSQLRGLAVLDLTKTSDEQLDKLHAAGVRGVRMHEVSWAFGQQASHAVVAKKIEYAATRVNRLGWVLDLYMHPEGWSALSATIEGLPEGTKVIADHWGGFKPGGETTPEFANFVGMVQKKKLYVKLSAFERSYHGNSAGMDGLEAMGRALIAAGSDRLLFASDWPNTAMGTSREGKTKEQRLNEVEEFRKVPHAEHIRTLRKWIKDDVTWRKLWIDTPASLFS